MQIIRFGRDILPTSNALIGVSLNCMLRASKDSKPCAQALRGYLLALIPHVQEIGIGGSHNITVAFVNGAI